ncbi:hypothetical protein DL96DRAFT_1781631, partial [Flagelloscypha sp. PMI_526]
YFIAYVQSTWPVSALSLLKGSFVHGILHKSPSSVLQGMVHIVRELRGSTLAAIKTMFRHLPLYPLLHELSEKPHIRLEELEYHSECLSKRSKMTMNGLLAIMGFIFATSSTPKPLANTILPFTILLWCSFNRAYYEGLPFEKLQERVKNSGPMLVATLYAIPEMYQLVFITYQVANFGGWAGISILASGTLVQLLLHYLPCFKPSRRKNMDVHPW